MPGYVDLKNISGEVDEAVLSTKLVTSFVGNLQKSPPLPSILATILLFDVTTGKLKCVRITNHMNVLISTLLKMFDMILYRRGSFQILEATEITARRTAAASVAATNILYNQRRSKTYKDPIIIGIFGAGVQGRSHALAFRAAYSNITQVYN